MNKGDLIFEVKIHNFLDRILVSKERRTKYYQKGCELKKKYQNKQFYRFKKVKVGNREQVYLVDIRTGLPVISNPRTAGTPKYLKIKGNAFYSGFGSPHQRIMVVNAIKNSFKPYFKKIKSIKDFPIRIEFNYIISREGSQDIDNLNFAYQKCTLDLLQELKIIPNDNLDYINKVSAEVTINNDITFKKLIIKGYKN